ncbi:MAG: hypothetical protein IIA60_09370 [Candidatus Marinimicrobia bacterium]|nr:hypothetical protein [Candidatus Neomarinimicrobiota bacterium]
MVIDASGNVGIGTASPSAPLHVSKDTEKLLKVYNPNLLDGAKAIFRLGKADLDNEAFGIEYKQDATASTVSMHFFGDNFGDSFVLQKGGNVGIGTTSPIARMEVSSSTSVNGQYYGMTDTNTGVRWMTGIQSNGNYYLYHDTHQISVMVIDTLENVGIGPGAPTAKLDVAGDVKANSIILPATSRYYAIPASEFVAVQTVTLPSQSYYTAITIRPWDVRGSTLSDSYTGLIYNLRVNAPVNLPHGATITGFQVGMTDDDAQDITAYLYYVNGNSNATTEITNVSSLFQSATFNVTATPFTHVVDNLNNTYMVHAEWIMADGWTGGTIDDLKLHNARITYTVTSPLP